MKCICGGKIERINKKKIRCVKCGAEFPVLIADSRAKRIY